MDDLTRHAQLQAERLATLARPAAVTKLRYLVEADPCNSRMLPPAVEARSRETTRKAAACLERISKPPKPRPAQAPAPQADTRAAPQRPDPDTSPAPAPDPAANSETAHAPVPPSRARSEPPPGAPGEMAPSCTTESRLL